MDCLVRDPTDTAVSIATVHAMKGGEASHVVLFDFQLFGHRATTEVEYAQDRNLLYIALSRCFLPNQPEPDRVRGKKKATACQPEPLKA